MAYQLPDNWELTGWELEAGELFAHSNPYPSTLRAESNDFPSHDVNHGLKAFSKPSEAGTLRSRVLPHIQLTLQHNGKTPIPSMVSSSLSCREPLWATAGELADLKAVGAESSGIHSNSHGPYTFLATHPQNRSQTLRPAKNWMKATPWSFACWGEAVPHPIHLHEQNVPGDLDLKSPLQAPQVLQNERGTITNSTNPEGIKEDFFPSHVHTMPITK